MLGVYWEAEGDFVQELFIVEFHILHWRIFNEVIRRVGTEGTEWLFWSVWQRFSNLFHIFINIVFINRAPASRTLAPPTTALNRPKLAETRQTIINMWRESFRIRLNTVQWTKSTLHKIHSLLKSQFSTESVPSCDNKLWVKNPSF